MIDSSQPWGSYFMPKSSRYRVKERSSRYRVLLPRLYPRFTRNGGFVVFGSRLQSYFRKIFSWLWKQPGEITRQHGQNIFSFQILYLKPRGFQTVWFLNKYKNFIDFVSLICTCRLAWRPNFLTFKEPKNRFQGTNSARLCSLTGRYDNPIPTRFLAP
jgi:hypothetical protein